jgi:hypothetical protein
VVAVPTHGAFGESAFGESAFGESPFGESAFGESLPEPGFEVGVEPPPPQPTLMKTILATTRRAINFFMRDSPFRTGTAG